MFALTKFHLMSLGDDAVRCKVYTVHHGNLFLFFCKAVNDDKSRFSKSPVLPQAKVYSHILISFDGAVTLDIRVW